MRKKPAAWANSKLQIENNTVINERANPLFLFNHGTVTAAITNNKFFGLTAAQIASGPNVQSGDVFLTTKPSIDTSHPWVARPQVGTVSSFDKLLDVQALFSPGVLPLDGFDNRTGPTGGAPLVDTGVTDNNLEVQSVPEPATLPLFATGLGMLGLLAWHRRRKSALFGASA